MNDEITVHKLSQLVYLSVPREVAAAGPPTVGALADYYIHNHVGRAYLAARFGNIPQEYESWKEFLANGLDDVRAWRIRNVMDDNEKGDSGFYGCTYLSPQEELVAAFRGSEMLGNQHYKNDYETDFSLAWEKETPQQSQVKRYLTSFAEFRARPFLLTGHSLGGNLAVYGALCAPVPALLDTCYAFNAPGFNDKMLHANRESIARVAPKLRLLQNQHDIVSSLLINPVQPEIVESTFCPRTLDTPGVSDIFYPHSNFVYRQENGAFVRLPDDQKDALCRAIHVLTRMTLLLPELVLKAILKIALDVIYTVQPLDKRMDYLLEQVTGQMVRIGVGSQHLELGGSLFLARQIAADKSCDTLYRELFDESGEDTARLAKTAVLLLHLARFSLTGQDSPVTLSKK